MGQERWDQVSLLRAREVTSTAVPQAGRGKEVNSVPRIQRE